MRQNIEKHIGDGNMKNSMLQDMLGMSAEDAAVDTNVDIVFAIDGTGSMQPLIDKVKNLFCNETGYQTPKLDTRAAIFNDRKILLVRENNGKWSLPGGWVDVNISVGENTVKEVKEESGLDVRAKRIIAVQDRNKHNLPQYAYGICKIFVLCSLIGGHFESNIETTGFDYFSIDDLPPLAEEKSNAEQIKMCFDAYKNDNWQVQFD